MRKYGNEEIEIMAMVEMSGAVLWLSDTKL